MQTFGKTFWALRLFPVFVCVEVRINADLIPEVNNIVLWFWNFFCRQIRNTCELKNKRKNTPARISALASLISQLRICTKTIDNRPALFRSCLPCHMRVFPASQAIDFVPETKSNEDAWKIGQRSQDRRRLASVLHIVVISVRDSLASRCLLQILVTFSQTLKWTPRKEKSSFTSILETSKSAKLRWIVCFCVVPETNSHVFPRTAVVVLWLCTSLLVIVVCHKCNLLYFLVLVHSWKKWGKNKQEEISALVTVVRDFSEAKFIDEHILHFLKDKVRFNCQFVHTNKENSSFVHTNTGTDFCKVINWQNSSVT